MRVPEGWTATRIGAVATTYSGGTPRRDVSAYYDGSIPWIKSGELNSGAVLSTSEAITQEGLRSSSARMVQSGTLLLALYGATAGVPAISHIDAAINQAILAIKPKSGLDRMYLYHWLCMNRQAIIARYTQGGQPNLSGELVRNLEVPLPPLAEQRRIAEILGAWDEAIALVERRLAAARERKRGLAQRLLTGQVRFPGFTEPWREVRLGEVGTIVSGGTPDTSEPTFWGGTIAWCTPSEVSSIESRYISATARTITQAGLVSSSAQLLPKGSLIVCTRATVGACAVNTVPMATNQGFKSIIPRPSFDSEFLYYLLSENDHVLQRYAAGSTFLELSKTDFARVAFVMPALDEQIRIRMAMTGCDDALARIQSKLAALRAQKRGLMQRLLTGEVRVSV